MDKLKLRQLTGHHEFYLGLLVLLLAIGLSVQRRLACYWG